MTTARRVAPVAGALLALVAGVAEVAYHTASAPRFPTWARVLEPLAQAPVRPGTRVALLQPIGVTARQGGPLLMEAAWQRPDLYWTLVTAPPDGGPSDALVCVGATLPQPGWHEVWRQGALSLCRRAAP